MRKRNLVLGTVAVMAVLAIVGAELVGNAVYYVRHGQLFYGGARQAPDPGAFTTTQAVFHPYLSFIHRAGRDGDWWTTNNKGFQVLTRLVQDDPACCNYPMPRREDEVLVGIFGGSVATGFALHAQQYPEFAARLASMPQWKGKRVRVLNFSMPGYKQPQQLIALAYFLSIGQHFDLILNIDGFNEVVTTARNWASGAEPSFPADTLWGASGREVESQTVAAGSNSTFSGLLYVQGNLVLREPCEIQGAVIVTGSVTIEGSSDYSTVVYDDSILSHLRREVGTYRLSSSVSRPMVGDR